MTTEREPMDMYMLGRAAHDAGKKRIPALDGLVQQEIAGMPVGTGAAEMMKRWLDGWDAANKEYNERMAELRYQPYSEGTQP
jgi:hypothetical protein